jgi:flagellar biogenesis protein FliO
VNGTGPAAQGVGHHAAATHTAAAPHAHVAAAHFGLAHILGVILFAILTVIGFIVHVLLIAAAILLIAYGVKRLVRHLNSSVTEGS